MHFVFPVTPLVYACLLYISPVMRTVTPLGYFAVATALPVSWFVAFSFSS
jgi:hypothetical protein